MLLHKTKTTEYILDFFILKMYITLQKLKRKLKPVILALNYNI